MSSKLYIFTKKIVHNEKQISMRTCRARMGAALQGAFAVMQEIPHSDISGIIKNRQEIFCSSADFLSICSLRVLAAVCAVYAPLVISVPLSTSAPCTAAAACATAAASAAGGSACRSAA